MAWNMPEKKVNNANCFLFCRIIPCSNVTFLKENSYPVHMDTNVIQIGYQERLQK